MKKIGLMKVSVLMLAACEPTVATVEPVVCGEDGEPTCGGDLICARLNPQNAYAWCVRRADCGDLTCPSGQCAYHPEDFCDPEPEPACVSEIVEETGPERCDPKAPTCGSSRICAWLEAYGYVCVDPADCGDLSCASAECATLPDAKQPVCLEGPPAEYDDCDGEKCSDPCA